MMGLNPRTSACGDASPGTCTSGDAGGGRRKKRKTNDVARSLEEEIKQEIIQAM